ncbi:MAG: LuxR family transcriptional regulator, partial [Alphaproteobacteria bacterium]|nr:LuxR family transcriptional regulator [Alphaproteobacteria bacterium]
MGNKTAFARVADRPYLIEVNGVYFTQREVEIISHLMGGKSIKTIANSLNLSPRTVEVYLNKIKSKVNKTSRDGIIDFIEKSGRLLDFKQYYLTNMKGYENSSIIRENSELQEKIEPPEDKNLSSFAKRKY